MKTATPLKAFKPKKKKCRNADCRQEFITQRPMQAACGVPCAMAIARKQRERNEAKKRQRERVAIREAKAKTKTRRDRLPEAQAAFNAFIRERDADLPCICCGSFGNDEGWLTGGKWDAGHFLSRGAFPELRFDEDNCHKQLKSCNAGSSKYARKGRTVNQGYRERLIEKIGIERVERLEGPHPARHDTADELVEITRHYRAKLRELVKIRDRGVESGRQNNE